MKHVGEDCRYSRTCLSDYFHVAVIYLRRPVRLVPNFHPLTAEHLSLCATTTCLMWITVAWFRLLTISCVQIESRIMDSIIIDTILFRK